MADICYIIHPDVEALREIADGLSVDRNTIKCPDCQTSFEEVTDEDVPDIPGKCPECGEQVYSSYARFLNLAIVVGGALILIVAVSTFIPDALDFMSSASGGQKTAGLGIAFFAILAIGTGFKFLTSASGNSELTAMFQPAPQHRLMTYLERDDLSKFEVKRAALHIAQSPWLTPTTEYRGVSVRVLNAGCALTHDEKLLLAVFELWVWLHIFGDENEICLGHLAVDSEEFLNLAELMCSMVKISSGYNFGPRWPWGVVSEIASDKAPKFSAATALRELVNKDAH